MPMLRRSDRLAIRTSEDLVTVRRLAREFAAALKFSSVAQTKLLTAVSELARNAVDYAGGASVTLEEVWGDGRVGLKMVFEDHGPGIADIALAMRDGYSTSGGMGIGLGGARRLVDDFVIRSTPGEGTTVTITCWG